MRFQLRAPLVLGIVLALHEIWTDRGETGMIGPGHVRQRLGPWRILRPVREPSPLPFWLARTFLSLIFHGGQKWPRSSGQSRLDKNDVAIWPPRSAVRPNA
jgi:hypothetical protein